MGAPFLLIPQTMAQNSCAGWRQIQPNSEQLRREWDMAEDHVRQQRCMDCGSLGLPWPQPKVSRGVGKPAASLPDPVHGVPLDLLKQLASRC